MVSAAEMACSAASSALLYTVAPRVPGQEAGTRGLAYGLLSLHQVHKRSL